MGGLVILAGNPGTVIETDGNGITVATGKGALILKCLQAAGKKICDSASFLRGTSIAKGDCIGEACS